MVKEKHQRMNQSSEGASFMSCCLLWISVTAFWRYMFFQFCLIASCCSWEIRLFKYRSIQSMSTEGIRRSGNFWMIENMRSSSWLYSLWKKFFIRFGFLISIFIKINSLKFIVYLGK